jgi:hypothetical protein
MAIKDCAHEEWLDSGMCLICSPTDTWQHHAACIDHDPDLCFPENDEPHLFEIAKKVCEQCPVIGFCLEIGINEKYGVWGGLTPEDRFTLAKSPKLPKDRLERRKHLRITAWLS